MQTFANTGIKTEVIDEIISFAKKHDIHCVILFGSRARGDFKRTSDIDIAASGGDFDRFALDVDEEKSTLLEFDIVDLDRDMQDALDVYKRQVKENLKPCVYKLWNIFI